MFCASELVFSGSEGVRSRFHVLRARNHYRRNRGCQLPFSCFVLPNSFWAVQRASGPVFMFCAPGLVFSGTEGVGSRFQVLIAQTPFRRYRGRQVPFSSFAPKESFSAVPRASGTVFLFCAPELVFGVTEGVGYRFLVLRSRTRFCGTEGVGSRFHVLLSRTRFRRFRGRCVPFSYFALPDAFWALQRASGPVFMFCASGLVFDGFEGVGSRFHVLRARNNYQRNRGCRLPFSCFVLPDSFLVVPEGVGSSFHVFRSRTRFRRYGGRRVPF
jgi:hypothetical protein